MKKQLAKLLIKLRDSGSVALSDLSATNRQYLRSLFETGVLLEERKGRGGVIIAEKRGVLNEFIEKHFPHGLEEIQSGAGSRNQAVLYLRDSKSGKLDSEPVLVVARQNQVFTRHSQILPIGELTTRLGIAAVLLDNDSKSYWQYRGTMALIENYEVFINWRQTNIPADVAIWSAGRISQRMINWLKSSAMQSCEYLHCGDYDPVGLDEFRRLQQQLEDRVRLYVPMNIDFLFQKYAKPALLHNKSSSVVLQRLRTHKHPDIVRVVNLIDNYNAGMEQEILLIHDSTDDHQ